MGVRGLQTFMEKCVADGACEVNIKDIIQTHKRETGNDRVVIAVDGCSCLRPFYGGLDWVCGGQIKEFVEKFKVFIRAFTDLGVELVFFFDGPTQARKRMLWCDRRLRSLEDVDTVFRTLSKGVAPSQVPHTLLQLPPATTYLASYAIETSPGCQLKRTIRECDEEMVEYAVQNRCLALLGQDSDYIIYDGPQFYLSAVHLNVQKMTTVNYNRWALARHLKLSLDKLPLFASLVGNDIIPFDDLRNFHKRIMRIKNQNARPNMKDVMYSVAHYIRDNAGRGSVYGNLPFISRTVFGNESQASRLHLSIRSYCVNRCPASQSEPDHQPLSSTDPLEKWKWLQKMAEKRFVNGKLDSMIYAAMHGLPYESSTGLEDFSKVELPPSALAFRRLRQHIFGIVLFEKPREEGKEVIMEEWCMRGPDSLQEADLVTVIFPKPGRARRVTRKELFELLLRTGGVLQARTKVAVKKLEEYVLSRIVPGEVPEDVRKTIAASVHFFCLNLSSRWKLCGRREAEFRAKYSEWLEQNVYAKVSSETPKRGRGRPRKLFSDCGSKAKKSRTRSLVAHSSSMELSMAAHDSFRSEGKRNVAKVISAASIRSPRTVRRMKQAITMTSEDEKIYTTAEALSLFADLKMTRHCYMMLRERALEKHCHLYPPYYKLLEEKQMCYPDATFITITDTLVEIELQGLLDHTVSRLSQSITNELQGCGEGRITVIWKWGCDGSGGHSSYKQGFSDGDGKTADSNLFVTSVVPLQMSFQSEGSISKQTLWQNPTTSSTRYCRPLRFEFTKETPSKIREECQRVEKEIEELKLSTVSVSDRELQINHILLKTMVDSKVCNAIQNNTSQQVCYICGAKPKVMNDLEHVRSLPCKEETFSFGLSLLHARIRFFECLVHISYKLGIAKWRASGSEERRLVAETKKRIQDAFWAKMNLIVDVPRQGGGTTNDGNTSRRFFENPEKSSEITGINIDLIKRFGVILNALTSGFPINTTAFREYASTTAELYVRLYGWFFMPTTVHKVLIHGADVIESMILPIGQLTEDAQELRHKEYRNFREHHSRKISRSATNEDILHCLLLSSDPLISSLRRKPKKELEELSDEVSSLLILNSDLGVITDGIAEQSKETQSDIEFV